MKHLRAITAKTAAPETQPAQNSRKTTGGYMTAEAAMIIPAVFALIIMLLYLTFYMYDR